MATFTWLISNLDYTLHPTVSDGAVVTAHWHCNAMQTVEAVGDGDDKHYSSSSYGTSGFAPDPTADGYIALADLTEEDVLGWCWAGDVNRDAVQDALQAQIDLKITPVQATGVPW
tara:strand:- start:5516 stop:5860 length:345 start_codon:yes stop_codon:yes gene_type:complete